ncbi:MAG: hypothetical protein NTX96_03270 [Candidatus Zambryskibacteria bacterium]|nr:hypothetical protein [Candidatus Zambryskibacteria bacterium]
MKIKTRIGIIVFVIIVIIFAVVFFYTPTKLFTPDNLSQVYKNNTKGFSIRYPAGFSVDDKYIYQEFDPENITGVKFTISTSTSSGTNLSSDSYVSVEEIPNAQICTATLFLYVGNSTSASTIVDGDTTYSVASSSDAGAGNRYEETVYALPGTNPCIAVRYFVHYGAFENYPAGAVREFDKQALLNQFDSIRHTLIIEK